MCLTYKHINRCAEKMEKLLRENAVITLVVVLGRLAIVVFVTALFVVPIFWPI